jgi:hypothetical protein
VLRPLPLLSFTLGILYLPGMAAPATAPRWALLSVGVPLLLWQGKALPGLWSKAHSLGLGLLLWAALSLLWASSTEAWAEAMWWMGLLAGAFVLGAKEEDLGPSFVGLSLGLCASVALALGQNLGWSPVAEVASPGGLFLNRNILGEGCALALVGVMLVPKWRALALPLGLGLVLTHSRGALLALGCVALAWCWGKSKFWAAVAGLALAVLLLKSPMGTSMAERLAIWFDTASGVTLLGHGLGSFYDTFPTWAHYQDLALTRPAHAHNEFLELLFELGPGLGLCLGLLFWCSRTASPWRYPLIASCAMACFSFPWHMPLTGFASALVLGHLAALRARAEPAQLERRVPLLGRMEAQLDL